MATGRLMVEELTTVSYGAETRRPWPVSWSGIWVGGLAALALVMVFGLIGLAVGAHQVRGRIATWHDVGLFTLAWSVFASFLAFVVGGWVAAKIGGFLRAESAMLHGAITWLVAVPGIVLLGALGGAGYFGGWYGGLAGTPPWAAEAAVVLDPAAAAAARNAALAAFTALVLGLAGGVLGGWMGSGEPMTFTVRRKALGNGHARGDRR